MNQPLPATHQTLKTLPEVLEPYFLTIPEAKLDIRRNKNAWTIREHLYHIAAVQLMLLGRMKTLRDDPSPVIKPFFPENEPDMAASFPSVTAALTEYRTRRAEQITLLESLPAEAWAKPGTHPEYDQYSLSLIVHHLIFHEYWHMYRIEELWLTKDAYLS